MICAVRPTFMKLTPGRAISPAQMHLSRRSCLNNHPRLVGRALHTQNKNESSSLEMLKVLIELCLYMLWMTDSVA